MLHKKITIFVIGTLLLISLLTSLSFLLPDRKPIEENLPPYKLHNYDFSNLKSKGEFLIYEDDNYIGEPMIDVSEHNGDIDFKKVIESGINYVYIRLGWRGYSEGVIHIDKTFEKNYENAKKAGMKIGVYFFSQAASRDEAIEEAKFVLANIIFKKIDLPIAYDYEDADEESRIATLTTKEITTNAVAFMAHINRKGYKAILYTNLDWLENRYDLDIITKYHIWYAQYYYTPEYPYSYEIWQYSENGHVDGIDGDVDLNIIFTPK